MVWRSSFLALLASLALSPPANGQVAALELLATGEFRETDDGSRLLSVNGGDPAVQGTLDAWGVLRPHHRITLLALLEASAGKLGEYDSHVSVPELVARVELHPAAVLQGGRFLSPVGAFGFRRFANSNPLIGSPDTYPTSYPWGAQLSGVAGRLDYRIAAVNEPIYNERYLPNAGKKLRPAAAAGIRTGPSLRLGVSATYGPYLGKSSDNALPAGSEREDFKEVVLGFDGHFSQGHFELWTEVIWNSYEVPTIADPVEGLGAYLEVRTTLSPRWYIDGRFERNRYAFILPISPSIWVATARTVLDGEIGIGYRVRRDILLKASYRRDHWPEAAPPGGPAFPDGHALAVQGSWFVDLGEVLRSKY